MRRILAVLLASCLVVLTPAVAAAGSTTKRDPDDSPGRLDLKRISLKTTTKAGRSKVVGSIATHQRFRKADLDAANSFRVMFRTGPSRYRGVHVFYVNDELFASLCTYETATQSGGADCSTHRVRRTSGHSVRFVVPRSAISKRKVLRWRGHSMAWTRTAGCRTAPMCNDFVGAGSDGEGFLRWRP